MFQKPRRGDILTIKLSIMPGTFSQIYIQIFFAVKGRENLIANSWKSDPNLSDLMKNICLPEGLLWRMERLIGYFNNFTPLGFWSPVNLFLL